MPSASKNVTKLLKDWRQGDQAALNQLMPVVYEELRKLGASWLRRERPGHTLQPTALIHEAYLRLIDQDAPEWESRTHFFGIASRLMRQILVEHARRRATAKRGGRSRRSHSMKWLFTRRSELLSLWRWMRHLVVWRLWMSESAGSSKCAILEGSPRKRSPRRWASRWRRSAAKCGLPKPG